MIRLFIDNYNGDMFLRIDTLPSQLKIADCYYLFDFLEISDSDIDKLNLKDRDITKYGVIELLKYWKARINSITQGQNIFLPFDISDQSVSGLLLEKIKKGFKTKLVYTDMQGANICRSQFDKQLIEDKIEFHSNEQDEWLISEEGIYGGLEWSINELKIKTTA
ncbi:MAG TPA: hypothetical protein VNZ49_01355 [Bacteroidia bacterium]|jgi:hypothetical protein|nr:hypothetical protein [Bacteroidia bacterium]